MPSHSPHPLSRRPHCSAAVLGGVYCAPSGAAGLRIFSAAFQYLPKPLSGTCSAALRYPLSCRPHLALDYDVPQVVYQRLGRPLSPVIIPAVQEVGW